MALMATDKQIRYLNLLANKIRVKRKKFPDAFSKISAIEEINWEVERQHGMTIVDASIKIDAYQSVIRGMNTILKLCNKC